MAPQLLIYGRILGADELIGKIEAVDAAALAGVSRRMLAGPLTTAATGPTGKLESHERLAARLG